jgi:hypothetical protein
MHRALASAAQAPIAGASWASAHAPSARPCLPLHQPLMRLNLPAYAALHGLMPARHRPQTGTTRPRTCKARCEVYPSSPTVKLARARLLAAAHARQRFRASRLLAHPASPRQNQTPRRRRRQRLRPHANRPPPTMTRTTIFTCSLKRAWHADWHLMELLGCPPTSAHFLRRVCARSTTTTSTSSYPRP